MKRTLELMRCPRVAITKRMAYSRTGDFFFPAENTSSSITAGLLEDSERIPLLQSGREKFEGRAETLCGLGVINT